MGSAAKIKSCCLPFLPFLLLITISEVTGFYHPIDEAANCDVNESFGYGVQIPGNVKIPGRAITSFIPAKIIPPINVTRVLTTCHDGQTSVSVEVYEGDSSVRELKREQDCVHYYESKCEEDHYDEDKILNFERMVDCVGYNMLCYDLTMSYRLFGNVELHEISPAPRGLPQIEVTFALKDLRLHVTVIDKATMKSNSTSFMYGRRRSVHLYYLSRLKSTPAEKWEDDPTTHKATRNYIHPHAVCLYDAVR